MLKHAILGRGRAALPLVSLRKLQLTHKLKCLDDALMVALELLRS